MVEKALIDMVADAVRSKAMPTALDVYIVAVCLLRRG